MAKLSKLAKVSDSFTAYRYENGYMIEVTGQDANENWKTVKILCNTDADLKSVIDEYNQMELDH